MRRWLYALIGAVVLIVVAGGGVWRAIASPHYYSKSAELAVVAYPDPDHAWVAGSVWGNGGYSITGGTVYATTDGGREWRQSLADWSDPFGIAFANARCGWLVVQGGLLATSDGGATWSQQRYPKNISLTGVACTSASHAWAVGDRTILATSDGGQTWRRQYRTKTGDLWSIAFADGRHGWAVGDDIILATTDGGASWQQQAIFKGFFLRSVACGDAHSAWAVGSSHANRDVILATTDGGTNWRIQYTGDGPDSQGAVGYSAAAFADALHGWVVGLGGTILATTDGGRTWSVQRSGTRTDLNDVAFADAEHGIAVGAHIEGDDPMAGKLDGSIILRTTDGGATWQH